MGPAGEDREGAFFSSPQELCISAEDIMAIITFVSVPNRSTGGCVCVCDMDTQVKNKTQTSLPRNLSKE